MKGKKVIQYQNGFNHNNSFNQSKYHFLKEVRLLGQVIYSYSWSGLDASIYVE